MNAYDKEGQSLRRNLLVFNPEEGDVVVFYTRKISDNRNDVIHNASGPAVKFGKTSTPASAKKLRACTSNVTPTDMPYRYKIIQVERSRYGALLAGARIRLSPDMISAVLNDEMLRAAGADSFAVECDTFAWFEACSFITLILREDDPHFNIDIAMSQLANLPGKEGIDFLELIEARITRRESLLDSILRGRGLRPVSAGGPMPHHGMGGMVYQSPAGGATPVFAAPPLPKLLGNPGDGDFDGLIDLWFRQLQAILAKLKKCFGKINLVLEGGGNVPAPDWFKDWCAAENIIIEVL